MVTRVVTVPKLDKMFAVADNGIVSLRIDDTLKQDDATGAIGVAIPKKSKVFFQIHRNYETQGGTFTVSNGLTTAPFDRATIKKNIGGGEWNAVASCFVVPRAGTYEIKVAFRLKDGTPSRNLFINAMVYDGKKYDVDDGNWKSNSGFRYILDNRRIMDLNKGDKVYLQINATDNDTGANATISVYATDMTIVNLD